MCDVVIILVIAYFAVNGFMTGFIMSATKLAALIAALIVAIKYNAILADYLIVSLDLDERISLLFATLLDFLIPGDFS